MLERGRLRPLCGGAILRDKVTETRADPAYNGANVKIALTRKGIS